MCSEVSKEYSKLLREHFCQVLNPVTVQHLETSEERIGEEIYQNKAEVRTQSNF